MEINEIGNKKRLCDGCMSNKANICIESKGPWTDLCDDCLQELNRKIVDHLSEKNL